MGTRKAAKRKRKKQRRSLFLGGLIVVLLAGGGIWAWRQGGHGGNRPVVAGNEVDHNAELIQRTFMVQQAVERYAQAHQGGVPQDAASFDREIVQGGFLQDNHLPDSPWGGHQSAMLPVSERFHTQSTGGSAPGADLGPARVAGTIEAPTDLGALCYEALGPTAYRLYGIGRGRSGQAAVIIQLGAPPSKR